MRANRRCHLAQHLILHAHRQIERTTPRLLYLPTARTPKARQLSLPQISARPRVGVKSRVRKKFNSAGFQLRRPVTRRWQFPEVDLYQMRILIQKWSSTNVLSGTLCIYDAKFKACAKCAVTSASSTQALALSATRTRKVSSRTLSTTVVSSNGVFASASVTMPPLLSMSALSC